MAVSGESRSSEDADAPAAAKPHEPLDRNIAAAGEAEAACRVGV